VSKSGPSGVGEDFLSLVFGEEQSELAESEFTSSHRNDGDAAAYERRFLCGLQLL
jgi:hypothetical protein